ncbi:MAG: ATP-binding protein [Chloroflexota bacterium]
MTLLDLLPSFEPLRFWMGKLGYIILLGSIAYLIRRLWYLNSKMGFYQWITFILFLLITPFTSLFIGLRLPILGGLPPPGLPIDPQGPAVMFFSAIPWFLAAVYLGPVAAAILALISGCFLGLWDTHSLFTPLEISLVAVILSVFMRQNYRTWLYRLLRIPLVAGAVISLIYCFLFLVDNTLISCTAFTTQSIANGLDYAITHVEASGLAFGISSLIAAIFVQITMFFLSNKKYDKSILEPSPAERSITVRFFYLMTPLFFILAMILIAIGWKIIGGISRQLLQERIANTAQIAAQSVPFFLEAGQDLILQLAQDSRLYIQTSSDAVPVLPEGKTFEQILEEKLHVVPYYHQLILFDRDGIYVASYPPISDAYSDLASDEKTGIELASKGFPVQSYVVPPVKGGQSAQMSFIASILDGDKRVRGILVGRSNMSDNPFTKPIFASLRSLENIDGEGYLLDENNRILYHRIPSFLMTTYPTPIILGSTQFDEQNAPDGTRHMVYYQSTVGRAWTVIISVPLSYIRQITLQMAFPLLALFLVMAIAALIIAQITLYRIVKTLKILSNHADRISQGDFNYSGLVSSLSSDEENEIGLLRRSFEAMRKGLQSRLDELNRLLIVSQGVASTLEIQKAIQPILDSALTIGVSSARIVLTEMADIISRPDSLVSYGTGPSTDLYGYLDKQILNLTCDQDLVILKNPSRASLLKLEIDHSGNLICPHSIIAVALRHEQFYYGTLWVTYNHFSQLNDEATDIRYLKTLAGQAAIAAANAHLYLSSEIERQRLVAILTSTPDPVLVTDQHNRLLLINQAARQILTSSLPPSVSIEEGKPIFDIIKQKEILDLLRMNSEDKRSVEIKMPDDRVYLVTASTILMDGKSVGRVCILQDVTYFKELDALKSEFVSTVSHDLRSPLTLIRGYATMLEMVGELNDQQVNYVRKITLNIENMAHLINNVLDLNRIDAGVSLQIDKLSIRDTIEFTINALKHQAAQKQIKINADISKLPPGANFEADTALLQQALYNLVENAIKFTELTGKVRISAEIKNENVIFAIIDTGIGIAPVDQVRLFEKFYRINRRGSGWQQEASNIPSSYQGGTGLGLAIVKSIVERHNGRVWVESQLGKGSAFSMEIPLRHHSG